MLYEMLYVQYLIIVIKQEVCVSKIDKQVATVKLNGFRYLIVKITLILGAVEYLRCHTLSYVKSNVFFTFVV